MTSVPELLDYDEAAALLRLSRSALENRVSAGTVGYLKVGARVFFTREHLTAYLERCEVAPTAPQARAARRAETLQRGRRGLRMLDAAAVSS